ncbi:hypothetical protein [Brucella intermedia]|uniref:Uncharacterized protein n=1 Tax=Brucella intermedia TaxID=94625 RepID=A0A7V6PB48_9HYPH|nr:hypothetical protein [Brucella intermedia]WGG58800.1 hypothetical protein QA414_10745 [Brucella intermedia]HHV67769.1 hypothetical protein [Brucella intermedia]
MNEAEIEALISDLQRVLSQSEFSWVADAALQNRSPTDSRALVALALLQAIESVTVDLAEVEAAVLERLDVEGVDFQPSYEDAADVGTDGRTGEAFVEETSRMRGPLRSATIRELASLRSVFTEFRGHLYDNGN